MIPIVIGHPRPNNDRKKLVKFCENQTRFLATVDDSSNESGGIKVDYFRRRLGGQAVAEDVRLPVLPHLKKTGPFSC